MSFAFQEFGLGSTEHLRVRDRIASILQTYFYGVVYAPCIFLSLGKEIESLRDCIDRVISENNNPNSVIFRSDNKLAAQKAIHLAIRGVYTSLNDVEDTLRTANTHRGQTEKWWMTFAKKIKFNGGDKSFLIALEKFRYHTWAFGVILRILKNTTEKLLETAEQNSMYLQELLADLLSTTGADSMNEAITSRFAEHADANGCVFTTGFGMEIALGISMYWTFKAIANIKETAISKQLSGEVCLALFKACWIFQKFQEDPRAQRMPTVLQEILATVSTELSFAAKTLVEINVELPAVQSLISCGDFRILLDDFDDEAEYEAPRTRVPPEMPSQGSSSQIPPRSPPQVSKSSGEGLRGYPIVMSNTAVHPAAYNTYEGYGDDNLSMNGIEVSSKSWDTNNHVKRRPTPVTPPTSPPGFQRRASSSLAERHRSSSDMPLGHGGSVDGGYHNYLTPATNPPAGGLSRSFTVIDSMRYGVPPLETIHSRESLPYRGPRVPDKPNGYSPNPLPALNLPPNDKSANRFGPHDYGNATGGLPHSEIVSPVTPSVRPETSIMEPQDYGVRPGELEIMKDRFRVMNVMASDTCDASSRWDECVIRIFKNAIGDLRVLTLREGSVDQRHVTLKGSEFIPEYGYHMHETLPVVFIRTAGPGGYSLQSGKRPHGPSLGSVELSAASLYYRFTNVVDMFEFQRALLGERVEAEVQVVRTIRYKRDGVHSNHTCRIQFWKENATTAKSAGTSTRATSVSGTYRTRPHTSTLAPRSTRIVMFLGQVLISVFVTDDITIQEKSKSMVLRIKPISYSAFGRSSVKACILGNRELSGGIRLDKEGLLIEDEEKFDDFKWFEIDFQTPVELTLFRDTFREALQDRRRERQEIEDLRRKASIGVRAN